MRSFVLKLVKFASTHQCAASGSKRSCDFSFLGVAANSVQMMIRQHVIESHTVIHPRPSRATLRSFATLRKSLLLLKLPHCVRLIARLQEATLPLPMKRGAALPASDCGPTTVPRATAALLRCTEIALVVRSERADDRQRKSRWRRSKEQRSSA